MGEAVATSFRDGNIELDSRRIYLCAENRAPLYVASVDLSRSNNYVDLGISLHHHWSVRNCMPNRPGIFGLDRAWPGYKMFFHSEDGQVLSWEDYDWLNFRALLHHIKLFTYESDPFALRPDSLHVYREEVTGCVEPSGNIPKLECNSFDEFCVQLHQIWRAHTHGNVVELPQLLSCWPGYNLSFICEYPINGLHELDPFSTDWTFFKGNLKRVVATAINRL